MTWRGSASISGPMVEGTKGNITTTRRKDLGLTIGQTGGAMKAGGSKASSTVLEYI